MVFSVGDHVVHPLHGAGTIAQIPVRQGQRYYALHLALDGVVIYIPVQCSAGIGLRPVCSRSQALAILCGDIGPLPPQPHSWNQRYRENMARIRSGDVRQVAQVVACLRLRSRRRALAGGERRMLECAEKILHSELMLAIGTDADDIRRRLDAQWNRLNRRPG